MKKLFTLLGIVTLFTLTHSKLSAQCQSSIAGVVSPIQCNGDCNGAIGVQTTGGTLPYTVVHPGTGQPMTYSSFVILPNLCAGTYTVYINDATGNCPEYLIVSLTEPTPITIAVSGTAGAGCTGTLTSTVNGGTPGYAYNWIDCSNGTGFATTPSVNNVCDGQYALVVTDMNGCTDTSACYTLNSGSPCNLTSIASVQNNVSCYGFCDGMALIYTTGGNPPYTALLSSGQTIQYSSVATVYPLCAGTYTAITTDINSCSDTVTFTITEPPAITTVITGTAGAGCTGSLASNVSGGTAGYTYNWINCSNGNSIATTASVSNVCDGMYMLVVTDANGCVDSTSCYTLNSGGPCNMVSTAQTQFNVTCNGGCDGLVLINTTNGTPPYTATDQNGNSIQYSSVGTVYPLCAGIYVFTVTDAVGCTDTVTAIVTEPTAITTTANFTNPTTSTSCDGTLNGAATGGTGTLTYAWVNCFTNDTIANTPNVTNVCEGTYWLIVTDDNGCVDSTACMTLAAPNGINENNRVHFSIYPNPASGQVIIENNTGTNYTFEMVNVIGETVYVSSNKNTGKTMINLSSESIARGTYFLRINTETGTKVYKLMVER